MIDDTGGFGGNGASGAASSAGAGASGAGSAATGAGATAGASATAGAGGTASGGAGVVAAGASGTAAASATGLMGFVAANAGLLSYLATAVVATMVVGGGVFGLSVSDLAKLSLHRATSLAFDFRPPGIISQLEDGYSAHEAAQALAIAKDGEPLPLLPPSQVSRVKNVSQNIIAQAQQDKASLTQQAAQNDKLAGFKTSDDAKIVFDPPKPKATQTPTPPGSTPEAAAVSTSAAGQLVALIPATGTPTPTNTPAGTLTSTPTSTQTPTPTSTFTPTAAVSATTTPTFTFTPSETPTSLATSTTSPTPTLTFTPVPTDTPSATPTNTFTPTPTFTFTPTPTNTFTPTPTNTFTPTPTNSPTNTPTNTPAPATATSTPQPVVVNTSPGSGFALMTLSGMVPGDSISRSFSVQVANASSFSYTLSTSCTANCSSTLWTDSTSGLQVRLLRGGTVFYGPAPINISSPVTAGSISGQSDTISVQVSLPSSASNALANQAVTVTFTWVVSTP